MDAIRRGSLPADGIARSLLWISGIKPSEIPDEPALSMLLADPSDSGFRIAASNAGTLPSLAVGSRWKHQRCIYPGPKRPNFSEWVEFERDSEFVHMDDREEGRFVVPKFAYPLHTREMLAAACVAGRYPGGRVLIPCIEVMRAWYGRSTALANAMFAGNSGPQLHRIFDLMDSGPLHNGNWVVRLRVGMCRADAHIAAMLACDEVAMFRVKQFQGDQIQSHLDNMPRTVRIAPPLVGTQRIRGFGIPLRPDLFLLTTLLGVPFPAMPAQVLYALDTDPRGDATSDDSRRSAWPGKFTGSGQDTTELRHRKNPDYRRPMRYESCNLPEFFEVPELVELPPRPQRTQAVPGVRAPPNSSGEGSTAPGATGDDLPGGVRFGPPSPEDPTGSPVGGGYDRAAESPVSDTDKPVGDAIRATTRRLAGLVGSLTLAKEVADKLVQRKVVLACESILVSPGTKTDPPVSQFPKKRARNGKLWWRVEGRQRQLVVFELKYGKEVLAYLAEIERRPDSSEKYTMALIGLDYGAAAEELDWEQLLAETALHSGSWRNKSGRLVVKKLKHCRPSADEWAGAIWDWLRRWYGAPVLAEAPPEVDRRTQSAR